MQIQSFNKDWTLTSGDSFFNRQADSGKSVTLPHDAMIEQPRNPKSGNASKTGYYPGGAYTYKKTFFAPADYKNQTVILKFDGAYMNALVYINGDFAGKRPYGYSNFYIHADRFLKYDAENEIKVVVKSSDQADSRWYTGTGIHRSVKLFTGPLTYIQPDGIRISTPDIEPDQAIVEVSVDLCNRSHLTTDARLHIDILDADGKMVASDDSPCTIIVGENRVTRRFWIENPQLWNVDTPVLYSCRVTLRCAETEGEIDQACDHFGLRKLQLDRKNGLRINGETVNLRGACIHHDNGVIGSRAFDDAETRRVRIMKDAGYNAIRSSHYPMSNAMLDACDRLGMLVMDETFDIWSSNKSPYDYALYFEEWWEADTAAMVQKDFNHPCVILYSIGNEIPETGSKNGSLYGRRITEKIRSLDRSRFIINSINGMLSAMDAITASANSASGEINSMMSDVTNSMKLAMDHEAVGILTEEAYADVDISGYNYMDSRYIGDGQRFPNRIICGSETFPADIDTNWRFVKDHSYIIGDFTWTGWDYLGEAGIGMIEYGENTASFYGEYPWVAAYCGDMDLLGSRRPQSYYREIVWGLRSEPYIAVQRPAHYGKKTVTTPWSWTNAISSWTWPGYEDKPIIVEVYSDADEVALMVNDVVIDRKPCGESHRFKAIFDTFYTPGTLIAVAYKDGKEVSRYQLASADMPTALAVAAESDTIALFDGALAYAGIKLIDANGILNTACDEEITVKVTGCGELLGFGSANPKNTYPYTGSVTQTFDGQALAVIRPTDTGEITVTASSSTGSASATILVQQA